MFPAGCGLFQCRAQLLQLLRLNAYAVVQHPDAQQTFFPQGDHADAHHAALFLGADAVLEGVFHDGLQDKGRHHSLGQVQRVRKRPLHLHPVAKAHMVDGVVFVHNAHLPGEGHLFIVAHQAVTQQMGKRHDECLCAVGGLCARHLLDDVQGVEQKMRVDLAAQLL